MASNNYEHKYKETEVDVETYIAKLKYSLEDHSTRIRFQRTRLCDEKKDVKYTNEYTFDDLFPDENESVVFRRELKNLTVGDYIETVEDTRRKGLDHFRVFGRVYNTEDVYIKIRVNLLLNGGVTFIMSFHYAERELKKEDYPYKKE